MSWAAPFTWATGDPVTAGKLNQGIRDNELYLYGQGADGHFVGKTAGLNYIPPMTYTEPLHGTVEFDPTGYLGRHAAGTALPWQGMPLPRGVFYCLAGMDTPAGAYEYVCALDDTNFNGSGNNRGYGPSGGPTVWQQVPLIIASRGTPNSFYPYKQLKLTVLHTGAAGYINTWMAAAQLRGF